MKRYLALFTAFASVMAISLIQSTSGVAQEKVSHDAGSDHVHSGPPTDLKPGDRVEDFGGVVAYAPPPNGGVFAEALLDNG